MKKTENSEKRECSKKRTPLKTNMKAGAVVYPCTDGDQWKPPTSFLTLDMPSG